MTVGARIKQARKLRDVGRPALAERTGIPYSTLAGIENDDQASSTQLHAIAAELRVRAEWLATGKKPIEAPEAAGSQPARLDPDIVAASFKLLRDAYGNRGKTFDPVADPDLFVFAYHFLAEQEGETSPANLIDFGQRLADRMREREEAANGEQGKARGAGAADHGARKRGAGKA
jgi:transcriptional regulator with XRE-family HTH domain